jgi:serum/glucocorticoid-regulated kinase 2
MRDSSSSIASDSSFG